ncbi:MerR family transcriptional regulator [Ammoniphilus sp. YIM 78166]|uniref:MerR family transcriptional regulator n=1 Tax=Ammoniphilus sp. YIM 78166 TaxID=1644106 RepID=UPI00106F3EF2|nr:MerR family transcriptional regulator [Ammoniphilus sp. YIM 78166]
MKIGSFAKKFNASIDTIRYYTNFGLLIPVKKDSYYEYDQTCEEDMKIITELKSFEFTLNEIRNILDLKRITLLRDHEDLNLYVQLLERKKEEISLEISKLHLALQKIDKKIDLLCQKNHNETVTGLSFSFLRFLRCPLCTGSFQLENALIQNESLIDASIQCACGYHADIRQGILFAPSLDNSTQNIAYLYEQKTLGEMSTELIQIIEKCSLFTYQKLRDLDLSHKVIFEPCIDTFVFLPKYIHLLPDDAYYIFCGSNEEMIVKLKSKIDSINPALKVLYIVNSSLHLPVATNSIDFLIDSLSFNDYALFNNVFPLSKLTSLCKEKAMIIGCFAYHKQGAKSLRKLKELYPNAYSNNAEKDFIKANINTYSFEFEETFPIGETKEPGIYIEYHVENETMFFEGYIGRRMTKHS